MADVALTDLPLETVRDMIADGETSSREVAEACLARLDGPLAALNATAGIDHDDALAQADAADAVRSREAALGPLHGVPLAHKDMFYRQGRISACGSRIRAGVVADKTSTVLRRFDAAGALDVARLNMVEFALGVTGHNEITGHVRNPWNADYIPGGSSSGSGVAVAGGGAYGAMGSDTGGSVRFPASCCGVVGLRPTLGRISRYGCMPLSHSFDTVGPLTRTVRDNALLYQVIAGFDHRDPAAAPHAVPEALEGIEDGVAGFRLGVPEGGFLDAASDEVRARIEAAIEVYRKLGAEIVAIDQPASLDLANQMCSLLIATEGAALHAGWLEERPDDYGRQTYARFLSGMMTPATRYLQALNLRRAILEEYAEAVIDRCDAMIAPVMMDPVPTIEESDLGGNPGFLEFIGRMGIATRAVAYLGVPGLAVPCGFTSNGLPTSFQLIGRPFDEATLYRAARAYERETGCTAPRPPIS